MIDRLNENEQRALLELLIFMARADGTVSDVEEEVLRQYADLVHVDFADLTGDYTPEELAPHFESASSRVIVLQELLRIAHIDGIFAEDEQAAVRNVAALLGIPEDLMRRIDAWVLDGLKWVLCGEDLLDEAEEMVEMDVNE